MLENVKISHIVQTYRITTVNKNSDVLSEDVVGGKPYDKDTDVIDAIKLYNEAVHNLKEGESVILSTNIFVDGIDGIIRSPETTTLAKYTSKVVSLV